MAGGAPEQRPSRGGDGARRLTSFAVGGVAREVVAVGEEGAFLLIDRHAEGQGRNRDERELETGVGSIQEAEAVARDYAELSQRLGRSAMPEPWW
jgi:hypothetical protein